MSSGIFELEKAAKKFVEDVRFPHCDQRVLHKKGVCEYCDEYPLLQILREMWGINFTGEYKETDEYGRKMVGCPAEAARPLETINRWPGNTPEGYGWGV